MPTYGLDNGTTYPPFGGVPAYQQGNTAQPQSAPKSNGGPIQSPGNNLVNPGYTEQSFEHLQNQFMDDPFAPQQASLGNQASGASNGEQYLNNNLGTLAGPGQGQQYWQQQQGQYMNPFAGEQFGREQAQNMSASGPAGAFYNQAMGQYGDFTGYSGPQNAQGQYGQAQGQLGNGTQGQQNMSDIAGQYGSIGQYDGPNLAAGQYEQTQGAFGDMPIANFDPFFDRARQLGVQSYNQGAAGRGVYGSSEALSGVGNVITDIEAQRALKGFDAEMQRAQEQRMRQQLLGEQARAGDLSSLAGFGANLAGVETFGNLNNQMGQLQNESQSILGQMANNADRNEIDRFDSRTNAMEDADRNQLARMNSGADVAFRSDDAERADYNAETDRATNAASTRNNRLQTASNIYDTGSDNYRAGLNDTMAAADTAENDRQDRQNSRLNHMADFSGDVGSAVTAGLNAFFSGDQQAWEQSFETAILPYMQEAGYSQQQIDAVRKDASVALAIPGFIQGLQGSGGGTTAPRQLDQTNPYG
jgi:hypothetical protein